jgi:hypothetical protein
MCRKSMVKTWLGMKNGDLIEVNGKRIEKSSKNKMRVMRVVVSKCREHERKRDTRAAKKAAKEAADLVERDAAKKRWSSFHK